jgi:MFS superfamily sulfate permease-like transporter
MGIAIASGAPVSAGLLSGIVGGLVVGVLAGAPLQVSGPAAGLTVIVYGIVQQHGLEMLGPVVLMAGLMQVGAGLLRWGQWFRAVSPAVIRGMLAGIGILILSSQFHVMVDDTPRSGGLANLASIPEAVWKGLPWPEAQTREQRKARLSILQSLGELHEEQVQIRELAAERVPHTLPDHDPSTDMINLTMLISRQERVLARFQQQETAASNLEFQRGHNQRSREAALAATSTALLTALDDLQTSDVADIRDSQLRAEETLHGVLIEFHNHDWAAKIGLLTILILVAWQMIPSRKIRVVPGALIAVVVTTLLGWLLVLPVNYVEVPQNLFDEIHFPSWAVMREAPWKELVQAAMFMAVVASAETLLCASAVDRLHDGPRTNYDRELFAQGIGNTICGCLGALPLTGVIVRSSANIEAGGKTRASAIVHGLWLLLFVALLSTLLRMIPTSCLAAVLVYTGYKLINPKSIRELSKQGRGELVTYLITVVLIVSVDLLTGVIAGIIAAAVRLLHKFSHLETDLLVEQEQRKATLTLRGAATFLRLPVLANELENVPRGFELHVDFEDLLHIDHACFDLLMNWSQQHERTGGHMLVDWHSLHASHGVVRTGNGKHATDSAPKVTTAGQASDHA